MNAIIVIGHRRKNAKGFGDFPNLRSRLIAKRNFSEKDFSVYLKVRFSIPAVKGAAFAQCFSRGRKRCFDRSLCD